MRILAIDPGTVKAGWGVIECAGSRIVWVDSGVYRVGRGGIGERLAKIHAQIVKLIAEHRPAVVSLERNFVARNVQSAFRLGEARGAVMAAVAAATPAVELCEYTPATIKKAVVGHGRADKEQVQQAVCRLLRMSAEPREDEADALATAACHGFRAPFDTRVRAEVERLRAAAPARPAAAKRRAGQRGRR